MWNKQLTTVQSSEIQGRMQQSRPTVVRNYVWCVISTFVIGLVTKRRTAGVAWNFRPIGVWSLGEWPISGLKFVPAASVPVRPAITTLVYINTYVDRVEILAQSVEEYWSYENFSKFPFVMLSASPSPTSWTYTFKNCSLRRWSCRREFVLKLPTRT